MNLKHLFLFTFFLLFTANISFACNCFPVRHLSVEDWNDADLVFRATLTQYKVGRVGVLSFETAKVYKGDVDSTITFYFQPGKGHTLLHAVDKFKMGDEWIVFARKKVIGDRTYYRLKDSPSKRKCALSRPHQEEVALDPYLTFLEKSVEKKGGAQKIYNDKKELVAEGHYENWVPIKKWVYYKPKRKASVSGHYHSGQREGEWMERQEKKSGKNQLIRKTIYKNGTPIEIHDYSHTGKVSLKKILSDSMEVRNYYRTDGTLKSKTKTHFEKDSTHVLTYSNEEKLKEERFLKGKKMMRRYWYDDEGTLEKQWERGVEK